MNIKSIFNPTDEISRINKVSFLSFLCWKIFFRVLLFQFTYLLILVGLFTVYSILFNGNIEIPTNNANPEDFVTVYGDYSIPLFLFIVPLCEESVFRLPLSFRIDHIQWATGISLVYFFLQFVNNYAVHWLLCFIIIIFLLPIIINPEKTSYLRNRYHLHIVRGSILSFSLLHLLNFEPINLTTLPFLCFSLFAVLCFSLSVTFIRFKIGFRYSVLFHILNNTISWLVLYT